VKEEEKQELEQEYSHLQEEMYYNDKQV
jgi:hypothetical protein